MTLLRPIYTRVCGPSDIWENDGVDSNSLFLDVMLLKSSDTKEITYFLLLQLCHKDGFTEHPVRLELTINGLLV